MGMATIINMLEARAPTAIASRTIFSGLTHALAGRIFTPLGALTGGIFGITSSLSATAIKCGLDQVMPNWSPIAKLAISYFAGIGVGSLAASLTGLPITFEAILILNLTTMGMVMGGLICTMAAITTIFAAMVAIRAFREGTTMREAAINFGQDALLAQGFVRDYIVAVLEFIGFRRDDIEELIDRIEQVMFPDISEEEYGRIMVRVAQQLMLQHRQARMMNPGGGETPFPFTGRTFNTRVTIQRGGYATVIPGEITFGQLQSLPVNLA
jgi:hypothetical protein